MRFFSFFLSLWLLDYPIVWLTPSSVKAAIGTEVDVTCTVQAWPEIEDMYWEKDYQRL